MTYKAKLNSFLLAIYFISLLAGVLHHHHFDFTSTKAIDVQLNSNSEHSQIQSGTNYTCIILQNVSNIQTALVVIFNEKLLVNDESIILHSFNSQVYLNQLYLSGKLLRAPPALS